MYASLEYTYFPNTFSVVLRILLASALIFLVRKLIVLHVVRICFLVNIHDTEKCF
jgi:hypothetical protein